MVLKEKLLYLEYRQRRSNLIFEGIGDSHGETDADCLKKLQFALSGIQGLDAENFKVDHCHRLDGAFRVQNTR